MSAVHRTHSADGESAPADRPGLVPEPAVAGDAVAADGKSAPPVVDRQSGEASAAAGASTLLVPGGERPAIHIQPTAATRMCSRLH